MPFGSRLFGRLASIQQLFCSFMIPCLLIALLEIVMGQNVYFFQNSKLCFENGSLMLSY